MASETKQCFYTKAESMCPVKPTWSLKKVTDVNRKTGDKRYGYECYACDAHVDEVFALINHAPEVRKLDADSS